VTDLLTDHALQFIQRKDDKPYCLVLAHHGLQAGNGGQQPTAADRHQGLYAGKAPRRRPGPEALKNPRAAHSLTATTPAFPDEHIRNRWRALAAIDDGVGRIIQALEAARELENTVIIFTSDQGYLYGEHGVTGPGRLAHEEAIRIPLVVHCPKLVKRGAAPSQMVLNIDVAPTLLDFAQIPVAPTGSSTAGTSLVGLLRGQSGAWRTAFLIEGLASPDPSQSTRYQAVRTANWKYIRLSGAKSGEELYDLHADHYELVNLAGRPTARNELRRWSSELAKVLKMAK